MSKTLCKWASQESEEVVEQIATCDGTRELRAICKRCGRLAAKKKLLCKAKKLDPAAPPCRGGIAAA